MTSKLEDLKQHLIPDTYTIRQALARLDSFGIQGSVLFLLNDSGKLVGTLTDGDIRRGILRGLEGNSPAFSVANTNYRYIHDLNSPDIGEQIRAFREKKIKHIPLINEKQELIRIINLDDYKGFLPLDVFIMAGGKGERLMPLTKDCPKPMLKIGEKPIVEHNIDRLRAFGVQNFTISINYLGHIIKDYLGNGSEKGINISYVEETQALGTIGSISLVDKFESDDILVMNSDLLTDINYADFFENFKVNQADMSVASTPYHVDIPYAVLDLNEKNEVLGLKEKPKYTYYSNAGIYLIKKSALSHIPFNQFYNATDLIAEILRVGGNISSFAILSYWLDIGKMPDYLKAQEDIKHLHL